MKIGERVDRLEHAFEQHIVESGEIRSDLKWLKGAFWALIALGTALTGGVVTAGVQHIWR